MRLSISAHRAKLCSVLLRGIFSFFQHAASFLTFLLLCNTESTTVVDVATSFVMIARHMLLRCQYSTTTIRCGFASHAWKRKELETSQELCMTIAAVQFCKACSRSGCAGTRSPRRKLFVVPFFVLYAKFDVNTFGALFRRDVMWHRGKWIAKMNVLSFWKSSDVTTSVGVSLR